MTRLVSLDLHGFKSIKSLSNFEIGDMTVLIGPNGAGKSNLLGFFRFLRSMATPPGELQSTVAGSGGGNSLLHYGSKRTREITAGIGVESAPGIQTRYTIALHYAPEDTLVVRRETFAQSTTTGAPLQPKWVNEGRESAVPLLAEQGDQIGVELSRVFRGIGSYHFHDTSDTARVRQRWPDTDSLELKADAGNLAPFLYRLALEQPEFYARIQSNLRAAVPSFAEFVLDPSSSGTLLLRWRELGRDLVFGPSQASDGTLRLMALVALLLQPSGRLPPLLIVDEPELGLHPSAIHLVAGLLKAASQHVQVIVATQSTALLDHFDPADVVVVERDDEGSHFRRLDPVRLQDWLAEYSMGELWEKNVLGGNPA
jgi:predicted ATPase